MTSNDRRRIYNLGRPFIFYAQVSGSLLVSHMTAKSNMVEVNTIVNGACAVEFSHCLYFILAFSVKNLDGLVCQQTPYRLIAAIEGDVK